MKLENIITAEEIIKDELQKDPRRDIFPITLIKFLLNRKKIISFFERINQIEIKNLPSYIDYDHTKCNACINNPRGMLCRKHTSIERIQKTSRVCRDVDTGIYIYMNEIFKITDDKLAVIYTPHTKLIQGQLTKYKIKKFSTISTYKPANFTYWNNYLSYDTNSTTFSSNELMFMYIKCWFNNEFSLVTIPRENNSNNLSFCLIPN